jgi:hypothetical protein
VGIHDVVTNVRDNHVYIYRKLGLEANS